MTQVPTIQHMFSCAAIVVMYCRSHRAIQMSGDLSSDLPETILESHTHFI